MDNIRLLNTNFELNKLFGLNIGCFNKMIFPIPKYF